MAKEAEILVHITAPSTSTDDTLYRAFAQAYLDFEPGRRTELPLVHQEPLQKEPLLTEDAILSPQLSFNSVWGNIRSPALAKVKKTGDGWQHAKAIENASSQEERLLQQSWAPPPSELPDSMPDNDISMDRFNTPTRILNYFLQTTESFSQSSQEINDGRRDTTIYEGSGNFTTILAQQDPLGSESNLVKTPRKAPQSTPEEPIEETIVLGTPADPAPEDVSSWKDALGETTVAEALAVILTTSPLQEASTPPVRSSGQTHPGAIGTSLGSSSQTGSHDRVIPSTQLPGRADSEPPSSNPSRLHRPNNPAIQGLGRSASDILPRGPHNAAAATTTTRTRTSRNVSRDAIDSAEPLAIDWSRETQIFSVEPEPSNHKLGPKLPAYLEWCVKRTGMASRYQPKFQAREMRPYERGYWLLGLDGWAHAAKAETWDFLGNFIRRDKGAGWGTRACRDEHWAWVRLYGWEHLAGELYTLLYVATYQRIKHMELTWYDGAGKELVIVGARAEKPNKGGGA